MKKTAFGALVAASAIAMLSSSVMAGFVASTGPDNVVNVDNGAHGASVQAPPDSFSVVAGTFSAYVATGPNDPQIAGDLSSFGYTLDADVVSVAANVVDYTGTYRIFYDLNGNNTYQAGTDTSVSFGTVTLQAIFSAPNNAVVTGELTQTAGPSGPFASSFADFGARYNDHPADLAGTYIGGISNPLTGVISGTITQTANAVVPLPASAWSGLALLGGLGLFGAVKRHRKMA